MLSCRWEFRENTIPRYHVAVRFFIQKPTSRRHQSKHISSWFHLAATSWRPQILSWPILYTCWIQSSPTQSREDYETWAVKANTWLHRWKFLITSTALRAYRNRHLGTLMLCWEAPKPFEDCVASFTRQKFQARVAEVSTFFWTQTDRKHCSGSM